MVRFGNGFGIRWYGLAYLAGLLLTGSIFSRWARKGRLPIDHEEVANFIFYAAMGAMIGGRLGCCLFYNLHEPIHDRLEIFALCDGGMASHGSRTLASRSTGDR